MQATLLNERYELIERLGTGGMATVWRGQDRQLHRAVAIKVLDQSLAQDPGFRVRYQRGARSVASLSHPNILTVYDWGSDDVTVYIVTELVAGHSLGSVLASSDGALEPYDTARVVQQVLAALGLAHRKGITHQGIKPANILIAPDGSVKVADFGIASAAMDATEPTERDLPVDTAAYLSPEQAAGRPATPVSDLYALGCVTYECLVGRPPFEGESGQVVALKHEYALPAPIRLRNPAVPHEVEAVVMRALAKNPEDRFTSPAEMQQALARAIDTGPPQRRWPEAATVGIPGRDAQGEDGASTATRREHARERASTTMALPGRPTPWYRRPRTLAPLLILTVLAGLIAALVLVRPGTAKPKVSSTSIAPAAPPTSSSQPSSPSSPGLQPMSPPTGGYRIALPASWRFREVGHVGDHESQLWYDPSDPSKKLEVTLSGCTGCVLNQATGQVDARNALPPATASSHVETPWMVDYESFSASSQYPDNGIVKATPVGSASPTGYIQLDLWLPNAEHSLATAILNSLNERA